MFHWTRINLLELIRFLEINIIFLSEYNYLEWLYFFVNKYMCFERINISLSVNKYIIFMKLNKLQFLEAA